MAGRQRHGYGSGPDAPMTAAGPGPPGNGRRPRAGRLVAGRPHPCGCGSPPGRLTPSSCHRPGSAADRSVPGPRPAPCRGHGRKACHAPGRPRPRSAHGSSAPPSRRPDGGVRRESPARQGKEQHHDHQDRNQARDCRQCQARDRAGPPAGEGRHHHPQPGQSQKVPWGPHRVVLVHRRSGRATAPRGHPRRQGRPAYDNHGPPALRGRRQGRLRHPALHRQGSRPEDPGRADARREHPTERFDRDRGGQGVPPACSTSGRPRTGWPRPRAGAAPPSAAGSRSPRWTPTSWVAGRRASTSSTG